jgi:type I restriction enzyme S subunit
MMKGWSFLKIKDYPIQIIDGDRGTNYPTKEEFLQDGYCLFLNTGNVTLSGFNFDENAFITEEKHKKLRKGHLQRHDSVLTTRGTIGNVAFYSDSISYNVVRINSGMLILRPYKSELDPRFFYGLLRSSIFQEQADLFRYGAAQPQLPITTLKHIRLPLPPLPIQQKIAGILSAYDNLIENNLKRIKLLEEMAQITYEEWFVRLRFPGYESTPINAETGLPEGWAKKQIQDIGDVITGKTPSTTNSDFFGKDVPFIKTPDMADAPYVIYSAQSLSKFGADSQKKKYLPKNSLMVSCIGTVGVTGLVAIPSQTNQQINSIVFKNPIYTYFMYCLSRRLKPLLDGLGSNGATMTNVNKGKFEAIEFDRPNYELLEKFHASASSNFDAVLNLQYQNQRLREARDILLPRLMTGMIDVESYDPTQLLKDAA